MTNLTFNNGTVEQFTLVLSQRDQTHLGQIINIKKDTLNVKQNLNDADELSFEVCKVLDGVEERLWDDIYDLRLVWVRELNEYFEIQVESVDQVYITKTITGRSLCESELSQVNLNNIEINTAEDIARPDYDVNYPAVFYRDLSAASSEEEREKWRKSSLLHRILEKVPAYTIGHVDETLMNLQRIFSISKTSILDFLNGDCAEQFNCLFQFDSVTRTISAYDLYSTCQNDACAYYVNTDNHYYSGTVHKRYRNSFNDVCPICGSSNITYYGQDTEVFVSTDNLTDEIKFDTDVDSMKNCFRLEAGDDNMTAAVINSNPNGTQYIYEFNDESKKDMPSELVDLIDSYDALYDEWNSTTEIPFPNDSAFNNIKTSFNNLCDKYNVASTYHKPGDPWKKVITPINGYINLISHFYNCIDFAMYLKSTMMDTVDVKTSLQENIDALDAGFRTDNKIGFTTVPTSVEIINNAVANVAKLYVNTGVFKVKAEHDSWSSTSWTGKIRLTSYEDDDSTAYVTKTLVLTTDYAEFMKQKINKQIQRSKENVENYDLLKKEVSLATYTSKLKYYCANRLQSFHDAIQGALGILVEAGQGVDGATLYSSFYKEYYDKLKATEVALNERNNEIAIIYGVRDSNNNVQVKGMTQYITDVISYIQNELNFKKYIYNNTGSYDLYNVYTTYIREDTYSNSNYISDDLNNDQLFENAGKFLDLAKDELHKSAVYQHSISTDINNLLAIKEFKPLLKKFQLGNWIRVKQDEKVYRLRLISYSINFGDLQSLNTEFSDVTETADGLSDIQSILKQSSSMASSYGYTQQQAEKGSEAKSNYIDDWVANGLNSALVRINNNDDEDIIIDNGGIHARTYDDILDDYDQEQLRITHNVIAFTEDNWQTVSTALGKFDFEHHIYKDNGASTSLNTQIDPMYGLVAKAVLAGWITGSKMESSTIIAGHIQNVGNAHYMDLGDNTADNDLKYFLKCGNDFHVTKDGVLYAQGAEITFANIGYWSIEKKDTGWEYSDGALYYLANRSTKMGEANSALLAPKTGWKADVANNSTRFGYTNKTGSTQTKYFGFGMGNNFGVDIDGILYANSAILSGAITATSGKIGNWTVNAMSGTEPTYRYGTLYYLPSGSNVYMGENNNSCLLAPLGWTSTRATSNRKVFGSNSNQTFVFGVGQNFGVTNTGALFASDATINGDITSSSGTIGGWTLNSDCIYRTNSTHAANNGMYFGVNGLSIKNVFQVDKNGKLTCSNVTITGVGNDNNAINLGNGIFTVTNNGKLTCSNIQIAGGSIEIKDNSGIKFKVTNAGELTAVSGTIGGWSLTDTCIYKSSSTYKASGGMYFGASGLSISNKFFVDTSGNLTCTGGADITGTLKAGVNSTIGPWNVSSSSIWYGFDAWNNASSLYFGTSGLSIKDKFRVDNNGNLTCTGANVSGDITSNNVNITGGTINITSGDKSFTASASDITITGNIYAKGGSIDAASCTIENINADKITSGTLKSRDVEACTLKGDSKFEMGSMNKTNPDHAASYYDSTLNWGTTWQDSLTLVYHNNDNAGIGVARKGAELVRAVYMHYNDIRYYWNTRDDPKFAYWTNTQSESDKRLKKNVKKLTSNVLQTFYKELEPIMFNYKKKVGIEGTFFGVFAQDMEKALEAIGVNDSGIVYEVDGYKRLTYLDTIGMQIGAIKDLYEIVNKQQEQINILRQEVIELKGEKG